VEDLCFHINTKISTIKKTLQLRSIAEEPSFRSMLSKTGAGIVALHDLLDKMEAEVKEQEKLKNMLKNIQKSAERNEKAGLYLCENIPPCLRKQKQSCITGPSVKHEEPKVVACKTEKKPKKGSRYIKAASLITAEEFEKVPAYLKGRLTRDQINAVLQSINKAVMAKYKIMHQPLKSMKASSRNLYSRFLEEETKDTEGEFFIVEADLRQFTEMVVDKRFCGILNILRHCQRLREVRGSGLVRY
ncbi:Spindle and kinetochore-associated protein 1, partial [Tyto alba]